MFPSRDPAKIEQSTIIAAETAAFLESGNAITLVEEGASGLPKTEDLPVSHFPQFGSLIGSKSYAFDIRD